MNKKIKWFLWPLRSNKPKPYIPKPKAVTAAPISEGDDALFSILKRSLAQRLIPLDIAPIKQPKKMIWVPLNTTAQDEEQIRAIYRRELKTSESSDQQQALSKPPPRAETPTPAKALVKHAIDELADLEIKREPETPSELSAKRVCFSLSESPSMRAGPREVNARFRLKISDFNCPKRKNIC